MDDQRIDRTGGALGVMRFRLRTMFAVVTAICIAVAWIASLATWKHRRHAFLAELIQDCKSRGANMLSYEPSPDVRAPSMLWLVEESGIIRIYLLGDESDTLQSTERDKSRARKAKALFPEAEIYIGHWYTAPGGTFNGTKFDE